VDSVSSGTLQAGAIDVQAAQNNIMHFVMVPKREPVKIGNLL